ncbi:MAG: magnesium transporter [Alphaproteobacteria bacterium]|jgi:magnesium transporter|nr:magnesium transporter [Alphaproteobacteria bacterium]
MLDCYRPGPDGLAPIRLGPGEAVPKDVVWIDLVHPTAEEERTVEAALSIDVPTREEMQEIEPSSRLYQGDGGLFLTATVLNDVEAEHPDSAPVTFVLTRHRLVTVRYAEPKPFELFAGHLERHPDHLHDGETALFHLLDTIIDRVADVLEAVQADLDRISRHVFARHTDESPQAAELDFEAILKDIARNQALTSKARESLVSLQRLHSFLLRPGQLDKNRAASFKVLGRDVQSLSDHASYLGGLIAFQLDATLGMIDIEQNRTIKIFSIAAVIFLPPTLIASVYGMNFEVMPELGWPFGYPLALALMAVSVAVTWWLFRRKGWL